jgi:hypothetical protein
MIANNTIQAAIVAKLKTNSTLTTWLTAKSAGSEIRESSWQGTEYVYPAVRVETGTQQAGPENSVCYLTTGEIPFSVLSFSEGDSSQEADELAALVNAALVGQRITGSGFSSLLIQSDGLTHAARTGERIWRAIGLYRMQIYES